MFSRLVLHSFLSILICLCLSSCSNLVVSVMQPAMGNLQHQTNIDLVCEGTPAYLLMIDSLLVSSPEDRNLLLIASQSYSAYGAALTECNGPGDKRLEAIAIKTKFYGRQLLSHYLQLGIKQDYETLDHDLARLDKSDVPNVFWGTFGWLTWVKVQKGSPESVADLVLIEKIMARLLEIDETYQGGAIHLFFGTYYATKPAMFGGRPDLSKKHFEKALLLADHRFLLAQTSYAETLARATMDQKLHDNLLREVLTFPLESAPEFALSNKIAVNIAKRLLEEDYFGE